MNPTQQYIKAKAYRTLPNRHGGMNKTEKAFWDHLMWRKKAGELLDVRFEAIKLKLGQNMHYTPDFVTIDPLGYIEFWEVKGGRIFEDSVVKFKSACELYPWFAFSMVQFKSKKWNVLRTESGHGPRTERQTK